MVVQFLQILQMKLQMSLVNFLYYLLLLEPRMQGLRRGIEQCRRDKDHCALSKGAGAEDPAQEESVIPQAK